MLTIACLSPHGDKFKPMEISLRMDVCRESEVGFQLINKTENRAYGFVQDCHESLCDTLHMKSHNTKMLLTLSPYLMRI